MAIVPAVPMLGVDAKAMVSGASRQTPVALMPGKRPVTEGGRGPVELSPPPPAWPPAPPAPALPPAAAPAEPAPPTLPPPAPALVLVPAAPPLLTPPALVLVPALPVAPALLL